MQKLIDDVMAFHVACDIPIGARPKIPELARKELRIELIREEVIKELLPAMEANDIV
jgi:hypothetical protein